MTDKERTIGDLKRIADGFHFTATRIGDLGSPVRRQAAEDEEAVRDAIAYLRGEKS